MVGTNLTLANINQPMIKIIKYILWLKVTEPINKVK